MYIQEGGKYGELFCYALKTFGILCIGIYRFRDISSGAQPNPSSKRYVITNPPDDFILIPTDKVKLESCLIRAWFF